MRYRIGAIATLGLTWGMLACAAPAPAPEDLAAAVNPFIGTTNGGNVFPGAVLPFGMVAFSPEEVPQATHRSLVAAPGGYEYSSAGVWGFGLAHVSGSGCAGAGGDIPMMPVTRAIDRSPSAADVGDRYIAGLDHAKESASPGAYSVTLGNGVQVDLSATLRTGIARFGFPGGKPANLIFNTSATEVGSTGATIQIDAARRTVSGSVTSGNFCGYLAPGAKQKSYYTLHFIAVFDQPFAVGGTWTDAKLNPGGTSASGGTGYNKRGATPANKGSGGWISFDPAKTPAVTARIGLSYVDDAGARANLDKESPAGSTFAKVQGAARAAWNRELGRIHVTGGTSDDRTVFYTALYHSLIHPSVYSDLDGRYTGMDGAVHRLSPNQHVQYANFSGWDIYRSQVQLVTLIEPQVGSDFAQSLLNQAQQNKGIWDRWTHLTGSTSVMNGDPSPPTLAAIHAFGGTGFDLKGAYASLLKAATVPTALDRSREGCAVLCSGQRPGLDQWLKLHYMPEGAPGWGSAADTLELAAADFGLAQMAQMVGDTANERRFLERSGWWRNLFNPKATSQGGYIQRRNANGSWVMPFDPGSGEGFVEGSGAQYLWMVPFDPAGLFNALGGKATAVHRLDAYFKDDKGEWIVTDPAGGSKEKDGLVHPELGNEPSIGDPWLYNFVGQPWKTQVVVRAAMKQIWTNKPEGISGNDDLGEMSSWYVWSALGMYPLYPGRAELVIGSPLFPHARIERPGASITITGKGAAMGAPYVQALSVNGQASQRPWLPASFIAKGGTLDFTVSSTPDKTWGAAADQAPPSFGPKS